MKQVKYISAVLILFSFLSCSKGFLEKEPLVGEVEEGFYKNEDDAIAAINAAYATLQFELTPAGHFRWFWGDIMSDDSEKGGEGDNDQFTLKQLEDFEGPTNTEYLQAEWEANYEGIYRANKVLEKVPGIEMDEQLKNRILGEAKFIRAWFHYNLVVIFGNVPLVDRVLAPSEYATPQSSPAELWPFIEKDLQDAINALPVKSAYSASDLGRITKGAAGALLTKSYLYQKKYAEAKSAAEAIVNSGEYALESDYGYIFTEAGENSSGSIFEIQYMNASGGNWGRNNANEGTFSNIFQRARGQFEGFGFNIPTQDLVDEFGDDPRLPFTVFREGDQMGDRGIFTKDATGGFPHNYYNRKAFNNKSEEAPFGDAAPNGGMNDRVIRYADVLLMLAESAFHTGDLETAKTALNQVRSRVGLEEVEATLENIYHERRVELGMEGHRFHDLVRTDRAEAELDGFVKGVHEIFPIPEFEITKSNGVYSQNPGY
ncbi:RagB/SusD family nutrient uptake outer membrane protein [Portibacter lacus]|uniref:Membrane protein n=1 Tax=Portibacter lacus TaxID=1099794 RepID=A0AA37WEP3_9BACT|nr:RagB/SusD family nutrient uptake outer membrane protein [Portibacter lacus]GLR17637.1 membrane protein [Portibacter lacus]